MAVYTHLSPLALERHLRPFRLGDLREARGVAAGTINTIYDVKTTQGRFILRILEDRAPSDARFEQALLERLAERGLPVPMMLGAGRRGHIVSLGPRQHLSVFAYMPGRELAVFEVGEGEAYQIGEFLGAMHLAARSLRRRRRNRFTPERIGRLVERCLRVVRKRVHREDLQTLERELDGWEFDEELPTGIVHADLFIDNARFRGGKLVGVLDFEMASTAPLAYDLAVAIADWAFLRDRLVVARARGLVVGYESQRGLRPVEREQLFALCCFAAARFAVTRFFDFEVRRRPEAERRYKDYRHFMARLGSLRDLGPDGFATQVLGGPECSASHL